MEVQNSFPLIIGVKGGAGFGCLISDSNVMEWADLKVWTQATDLEQEMQFAL